MELSASQKKDMLKTLGRGAKFLTPDEKHRKNEGKRPVSSKKDGSVPKGQSIKDKYYSCDKKHRYPSQGEATYYARKAVLKRGVPLRVYYCEFCNGYHITKRMNNNDLKNKVEFITIDK